MTYIPTSGDGYVGLFLVPDVGVPVVKLNITYDQTRILVEERVGAAGSVSMSTAEIDVDCLVVSGAVTHIVFDKKRSGAKAFNKITFPKNPSTAWWTSTDPTGIKNTTIGISITASGVETVNETYTLRDPNSNPHEKDPQEGSYDIEIPAVGTPNRMSQLMANIRDAINDDDYGSVLVDCTFAGPYVLRLKSKVSGAVYNYMELNCAPIYIDEAHSTFKGGTNPEAEDAWHHAQTCKVSTTGGANWIASGTGYEQEFDVYGMEFNSEGIDWDFRARFYNADNQEAIEHESPFNPARVYCSGIPFNGRDDVTEFVEVTGLKCTNASIEEGGGELGEDQYVLLPSIVASLEWDDMAMEQELHLHPLGRTITSADISGPEDGIHCNSVGDFDFQAGDLNDQMYQYHIPRTLLSSISTYAVYIYTASGLNDPMYDWPRDDEPNGDWSLVGYTSDRHMNVNLTPNQYVGFWVGFGTYGTWDTEYSYIPHTRWKQNLEVN